MSEDRERGNMILVGGLWASTTKAGDRMLSGGNGSLRFVILKNKNKTKESHPDYNLFIAQNERQGDRKKDDDVI
jgi:hypothetical protein